MNVRSLHLGKAISAALFVLLLSVAGTKNALAQNQVVTLQQGDIITAYYGPGAFVEAYNAATDGSIITLSGGSFTGCNIDKSYLTIRGAGPVADTEVGTVPTQITGNIYIGYNWYDTDIYIEGIYFPGTTNYGKLVTPTFVRCNFTYLPYVDWSTMTGAQFINCVIKDIRGSRATNTTFVNCVIDYFLYFEEGHNYVLYNCQVTKGCGNGYAGVTAWNSIIAMKTGSTPGASCNFYNCIGITNINGYNMFGSATTQNCTIYYPSDSPNQDPYELIYESYRGGDFNFEEAYLLLDSIATGFQTTDGTEVGIHGGQVPYTARPSYQMLRTLNVPQQSDTQGKLNVEIEIINQ